MQPDQTTVLVIVAAISISALVLLFLYRARRTASLRDRFGQSEYDRTLAAQGGRAKAETALRDRERRVAALTLRSLGSEEIHGFTADWNAAKARFVDDPAASVAAADRLIGDVMGARGYPVADFAARYESLTVDHGTVARHYRAGHDIAEKQVRGAATTEELRQAMIHYEALFAELAGEGADGSGTRAPDRIG